MGVTGLWTVVQPCARPIKLETLNRRRLAVDASIWIYQFLKAVRDKEGNALRSSHVVGFFRRICKLLFFGIKPVFVFDGGAPALKRQTIVARKARREGHRDDAARTAGKLLAVQMQRRAEEEAARRRRQRSGHERAADRDEPEVPDDELVYVEEVGMSAQQRRRNRAFKKADAYHLPDLDGGLAEMGAPNDPRIMSQEELEEYARHFHSGEDINLYDFSKIDFASPFFQSLPAADRYNILNAARLRSRLRMGYSKEQLDGMFPDRMAFSRFQIERVKERNELTQRLMNLNGMTGAEFVNGTQRVAGERGKEYVLVKNEGVEGGWALGVVSSKNEGDINRPIDVERATAPPRDDDEEWEDEDEFEDVPIEGINRLPKQPMGRNHSELEAIQSGEARRARQALYDQRKEAVAPQVASPEPQEDPDSLFLATEPGDKINDELFGDDAVAEDSDGEELQRAIAMSLEKDVELDPQNAAQRADAMNGWRAGQPLDFNKRNAKAGRAFAQVVNSTAKSSQFGADSGNAFANSTARRLSPTAQERLAASVKPQSNNGFSGPLPFESLSLGGSFLRKKKKPKEEGGFQEEEEADKDKPQPLPPWFSGDVRAGTAAQAEMNRDKEESHEEEREEEAYGEPVLRGLSQELIDLDASQSQPANQVIDVDSSADGSDVEMGDVQPAQQRSVEDLAMDDVAESAAAAPPVPTEESEAKQEKAASEQMEEQHAASPKRPAVEPANPTASPKPPSPTVEDEEVEWSESDGDASEAKQAEQAAAAAEPASRSPSADFEDVEIAAPQPASVSPPRRSLSPLGDLVAAAAEDDGYSDPEDEELMRQLAAETEEHERFAASLNAGSSGAARAAAYESEVQQLRGAQARGQRDADEVTQAMVGECQQLLRLFGLPYITAPMEAEAQCAELVRLGLVDGVVTDDSDIFLFGGTRVYKNMFNQARFVECYLASDLEAEYSLTRAKVIQLAHLLGSDYADGLPGIGPVTALEILSEFTDLAAFAAWLAAAQQAPSAAIGDGDGPRAKFRKKFRKHAARLFLPPGFPDARVDDAYLRPDVDGDPTPFQWGVPDLDALRAFLMQTVGWGRERADEVLVPVVRDMNRRAAEGTQANITRFFAGSVGTGTARARGLAGDHASRGSAARAEGAAAGGAEGFAPRRKVAASKRMETALGKLHARAAGGEQHEDEDTGRKRASDGELADEEPPKKARRAKGRKARAAS